MVRMARERKLTDEDVARLRRLRDDEGWSLQALADEFGVSRQHAGRLVRGDQRPDIAGADADGADGVVSASVDAFLAELELRAATRCSRGRHARSRPSWTAAALRSRRRRRRQRPGSPPRSLTCSSGYGPACRV